MEWYRGGESDIPDGSDDPSLIIPVSYLPGFDGNSPSREPSRINVRAVLILLLVVAFIPVVYFPLSHYQNQQLRTVALAQVKQLAKEGRVKLALAQLSQLLKEWPELIEALEIHARLLTETARTPDQALDAARVQDQLLRLDPGGPGRQENRARLVELYITYADAIRRASTRRETAIDKYESRYRAAAKIAQQRISYGADDAESHRLLARALEGLSFSGDAKALVDSTTEYEIALRRDGRDAAAAEHLAMMSLERRNEPIIAEQIIENLIRADPDSVDARLAGHRFFLKTHREERANSELEAAIRLKPADLRVRLTAAGDAIRRRDPSAARRHLDAIAPEQRQDKRVLILRGQVNLVEQHPEEAVDEWRKALALFEGNDKELTSRLAHSLILLGRVDEAKPLLEQFDRLTSDSTKALALFLHGLLEERTGRTTAAITHLEAARLSIDETTLVEVELALGHCYEAMNDHQKALICYRRAVQAAPLSSNAHRALARLLGRKSLDKASEQLEEAIRLIPSDPSILADLAILRLVKQMSLPVAGRDFAPVKESIDRAERLGLDALAAFKLRAELMTLAEGPDRALVLFEEASRGPLRRQEGFWQAWATALIQLGRSAEALALLERASSPDLVGDHASFRATRARLLAKDGRAGEARKLLEDRPEGVPEGDRAAIAIARVDLLQDLGEIREARSACLEWAKIDKQDPRPGLRLLALAQVEGDEGGETAGIGLSLLKDLGGDEEPYPLAAEALDLIFSTRSREESRSSRLERADELSQKLQKVAPFLPVTSLLRGILLERSQRVEDAIAEYRTASKGDTSAIALSRLVPLLTRLRRHRDLASLNREFGASRPIDQLSASAYLEIGETEAASRAVAQFVESVPDCIPMRTIQARILRDLGQPKEAEATLRTLIERDKNRQESWLAILGFQMSQGLKDEAIQTIEQASASYHGDHPEAFFARCRWIVGDQQGAARLFNQALARTPDDLTTLKFATEFAEASGRLVEAEKLFRTVLKLDGSASWAGRRLALLLSTRGDRPSWDEAWSLVAADIPRPADAAEARLIRATLLERSPYPARRLEALPALKALAEDFPATNRVASEARARLARAYLEAGDPASAAKVIGPAAVGWNASNPAILAILVEALARSGRGDEAEPKLDQLDELEPKSLRTACCRAWVFQARDRKDEAASTLEDAFAKVQDSPDAEASGLAISRQLVTLGQLDAAERVAVKMASKSPRDGWLLARLQAHRDRFAPALETCRSSIEAGAGRDAVQVLVELATSPRADDATRRGARTLAESILSRSPQDSDLVLLVGSWKHLEGKFEEESRLYARAVKADPALEAVWNNLAWVLGECLDRPAEALAKVNQAIRLGGRNPGYCDTRGVILTQLGKFDEAIRDLEVAVADQPSPTRLYHLARACLKANQAERHGKYRDLARKANLDPATLDPKDRADFAAVMGP